MIDKNPFQVKIEEILEENVTYIDISLVNDDFINVYKPNEEGGRNTITFVDTGVKIVENAEDGCIYDTYVPFDNIVFVRGIYNCPEVIEEEESEESESEEPESEEPESEEDVESN